MSANTMKNVVKIKSKIIKGDFKALIQRNLDELNETKRRGVVVVHLEPKQAEIWYV